jgi:uncharacterized protein (TIGR02246 family)
MLTHDQAVALFERRRQAWLAEDVDAYLALWASDMTFTSPVHVDGLRGRAAFAELVRRSLAAVRPLRFEIEHVAVAGSVVLAEWSIAVERRTDGREVAWSGRSACEMRDGLITSWREYWDPRRLT